MHRLAAGRRTCGAPAAAAAAQRQPCVRARAAARHAAGGPWHSRQPWCFASIVGHAYNFADAGDKREVGERRNRTLEKRASAELSGVVKGLVAMNAKQLAAVEHLLTQEQLQEIALAARLPRVNQGRKRHENRVVQLIRTGTSEEVVQKLAEAVTLAQANAAPFVDADVAARVEGWIKGLKAGDTAALGEVAALLAPEVDMQQLRQLARQLEKDAEDGGGGGGGGTGGSGGGAEVAEHVLADPELLAIISRGAKKGGGGGGARRQRPMSQAERKLRALLKPAALRREREAATE